MNDWIKTEDRLPETRVRDGVDVYDATESSAFVLLYSQNLHKMYIGKLIKSGGEVKWWKTSEYSRVARGVVTHWKPLPEPPGEEKKEND